MLAVKEDKEDGSNLHQLYLIVLLLIPLNFVAISGNINVSLFRIGFGFLFLIFLVALIGTILYNSKLVMVKNPIWMLLALLLLLSTIVIPWSIDVQNSIEFLIRIAYHVVAVTLLAMFLTTYWNDDLFLLISKVLTLTTTLVAITLIAQYFSITIAGIMPSAIHTGRPGGLIGEPNFAAGFIAANLPFFGYYVIENSQRNNIGYHYLVGLCISVVGIYLTGSRMGILLVFLFVLGMIIILPKKDLNMRLVGFGLVTASLLLHLLTKFHPVTVRRFAPLIGFLRGGSGDGSLETRLELIAYGVEIVKDNIFTGVGPGNYIQLIGLYSHNTYIDVVSQMGIGTFGIFLLLLLFILRSMLNIRLVAQETRIHHYYFLSYIILLSNIFFLSDFFNVIFWFMFLPLSITINNVIGIRATKI